MAGEQLVSLFLAEIFHLKIFVLNFNTIEARAVGEGEEAAGGTALLGS